MKTKIIKSIVATALLATTIFASNTKSNLNISVGSMKFDNSGKSNNVLNFEFSAHKRVAGDLYLGGGIEGQYTMETKNNSGRSADIYPSISYNITDDFAINATVGYTYGYSNNITYKGISSSIGAEYYFSKKFGVGIRYKKYDIDYDTLTGDVPDTLTATTISFNQRF